MKKLHLTKGSTVYHLNRKAEVDRSVDFSSIIIKYLDTMEHKVVQLDELSSGPNKNEKEKSNHIVEFTEKQWDVAKKRLEIIKPLLHANRTTKEVNEIASKHNIHPSTIYRWLTLYERASELSILVPKYTERGGKGTTRIREETELIINKVIQDLYLHKQKLTPKQVHFEIKRRCSNADLPAPHENTVRNRIKQLSDKQVFKMRESSRNAERLYRNTDGMFPSGKEPLEVIQIDHTPIDLIIVDEQYRKPIGRPYLTLAIDVNSRMIAGFYISLEEPSYFSASQCISQLVLTKEKILRDHNVIGEWNIWGLPKVIHMDNGSEFRSDMMEKACENFGISIEWRPVARPQFGAHIERLIGTSMQEVHTLPGTTFSNIKQRGEYNSEKESAFTLAEFEDWFCEYVINVYHKTIHSGIGMTPEKKYEIGIFGDDHTKARGLPERIEDEERLRLSFLPTEERTIQQTGVSIDKIHYYHDVLRRWIKTKDDNRKTRKFIFKIDPRDISRIWFFDPEIKEFFEIPYRNVTYPRISRWELKRVKQYLAQKNIEGYDESVIFTAYERMHSIRDDAVAKTKSARKAKEAKRTHIRKSDKDYLGSKSKNESPLPSATMEELHKNIQPFEEIDIGID